MPKYNYRDPVTGQFTKMPLPQLQENGIPTVLPSDKSEESENKTEVEVTFTKDQKEASEKKAADKTVNSFIEGLKNFTKTVKESKSGRMIGNVLSGVSSGAKQVGEVINNRRKDAGLTRDSLASDMFESPLAAAMFTGSVDLGEKALAGAFKGLGFLKNKAVEKLTGSGKEKEEELEKSEELEPSSEQKMDEDSKDGLEKDSENPLNNINENIILIKDSLLEYFEDLKGNASKEEEKAREDRDFWKSLFDDLDKDGEGSDKPEEDEMDLPWGILGAAMLGGLAAWLTSEGDFNNVFSGWTASLRNVTKNLARSLDDILPRIGKFADNVFSKLGFKPKPGALVDDVAKGVAGSADDVAKGVAGSLDDTGKAAAGLADDAVKMSDDALKVADDLVPKNISSVGDDLVKSGDDLLKNASKLGKFARVLSKAAVPLAIGVDAVMAASDINEASTLAESGEITEEQLADYAVERTAGATGSIGGGLAGAAVGATVGSVIPVVGTLLGGVVGGIAGAWLGEEGMTKLAESFTGGSGVQEIMDGAEEAGKEEGWFDSWFGGNESENISAQPQNDLRAAAASQIQDSAMTSSVTTSQPIVNVSNADYSRKTGGNTIVPGSLHTRTDRSMSQSANMDW